MSFPRLSILLLPLILGAALLAGGCAAPVAVAIASYGADGALLVGTGKTSSDHMASMVSKKDCALWRILRGRKICNDREGERDPYDVNYNEPYRSVSEDGVQYGPPLRAAPDAPASSWDVAAYKTAPSPPAPVAPAPVGPVTAVADAPPAPEPAIAAPAAPKPKKVTKGRSVKKPSRGPAAPPP
jgi:hypothetical protein